MTESRAAYVGARIEAARCAARLSKTELADAAGVSRRTLSRVISGERTAKMPEIMLVAAAAGVTVADLTGSPVRDRVRCSPHPKTPAMEQLRDELVRLLELNDYLADQAIPAWSGPTPALHHPRFE